MALIQPFMAVKCRTPEEVAIYEEIARAEGHFFQIRKIEISGAKQRTYITNYSSSFTSPHDVGFTSDLDYVDRYPGKVKIIVEASDLFRNHLISKRIKNERGSTE